MSEGPEVRQKLKGQLTDMLTRRGINSSQMDVQVLYAYKQGYRCLMDEIAPKLRSKQVERLKIEFAKNVYPTGLRTMYSPARCIQQLYPVDEMLSRELGA